MLAQNILPLTIHMKRNHLIIILSLIIFPTFFYIMTNLYNAECNSDAGFKGIELNGIVEKKYLDSNEHSYQMLEIRQFNN